MKSSLRTIAIGASALGLVAAVSMGITSAAHSDPVVDPSASPSTSTAPSAPADPSPSASAAPSSAAPTSSPAPSSAPATPVAPTYAPGMAPNEHAGWAVVDPTTGQITGGVIVCTPEVCGSGWFAGMRVVLQTLQDPVEAAHSGNGVGNVAGYGNGTYNFQTGQWTTPGQGGSTWQIPLAYPGADQGGTVHTLSCVANCPTATPTASANPSGTPDVTAAPSATPDPTASVDASGVIVVSTNDAGSYAITLEPRSLSKGITTVVARKNGKVLKTWTLQPGARKISLILPKSYKGAQLSVSRKGTKTTQMKLV